MDVFETRDGGVVVSHKMGSPGWFCGISKVYIVVYNIFLMVLHGTDVFLWFLGGVRFKVLFPLLIYLVGNHCGITCPL